MIQALVHGAGRMARRVLAQMPAFKHYQLTGLVSRKQPQDLPDINWFASLDHLGQGADILIDFTLPGGARAAAQWCARNQVALLSGTTGLQKQDILAMKTAARKVPVLWAPNLSPGVALITRLVGQAAAALGTDASIHITETHHQHKLDAPSGTALALAASVAEGRSERLEDLLEAGRIENMTAGVRHGLSFTSVREGDVIGEHSVNFVLLDEVIEITHKACSRDVFAKGALQAGEWLVKQAPGFYSTRDWLGLD